MSIISRTGPADAGRAVTRRAARAVAVAASAVLVVSALSAGTASAAPVSGDLACAPLAMVETDRGRLVAGWDGVQKDPHNYTAAEKVAMQRSYEARAAAVGYVDVESNVDREAIKDPITVETYFHIVREDGTVEGGNIPRTWLREQMKYFNHSFRGKGHSKPGARSPFKFELSGVTRTTNATWFLGAATPSIEREMKTALREESSTAETLNVYLTELTAQGLLGYAYLPEDYQQVGVLDGVVVETQSLPGGSADPYNLGGTVSHEVGHWLGLLHTFDGGCSEAGGGDLVADTPAQAEPTSGCPEGADTCPSEPGLDPIHNYMDYSYDACYDQFTVGQRERMFDQWNVYRDGVAVASSGR